MNRAAGFATGFLTFLSAHALELITWSAWFGGAHEPWFLNTARAAGVTGLCLFGASFVAGFLAVPGLSVAAGAATAMVAVLIAIGGSTIFPIVLAAGGLLIVASCWLGAWLGKALAGLRKPRGHS